jgi:uroporphyrinogen III methyltransferase/synthase
LNRLNIRIGSRESALAVIQSETAAAALKRFDSSITTEIITMKTSGDMILDDTLESSGGKGLFVKELDAALLDGRIDIAVHSLKDIPAFLEDGIAIKACLRRDDPRDALVLPEGRAEAGQSKPAGCSGGRRRLQLRALFSGLETRPVRGNVLTRLKKLEAGEYGSLVLAAASLIRLNLAHRISRIFSVDEMIPAAGQGIIAVCAREGPLPAGLAAALDAMDDAGARSAALAERAFVRTLNGGCGAPVAAYAEISGSSMTLSGLYAESVDGIFVKGSVCGLVTECEELGENLAVRLLADFYEKSGVKKGKVTLVGAGPGDAGLLGLRALRALDEADIVLYDNLAGRSVIARIPAGAKTVYAGKTAGRHALRQQEINLLLAKEALAGKKVVRLKGGDPFLFGRGGEELELLAKTGVPFEVIPGVTSALAVPAYAGIPVTHRSFCSQLHIVTARFKDGCGHIDYEALVKSCGTIIFLMGAASLESICCGLVGAGMPGNTPAAIIERGGTAKQRKVVADIASLHGAALEAGIDAPAVTVVGDVCSLSSRFSWFEKKPLFGLRVGVTRPAGRAVKLSAMLGDLGAEVIEIPAVETRAIDDTPALEKALSSLSGNEWLAFTSPAGVEVFFDKLAGYGIDIRSLYGVRFAAIGKTTAACIARRGITGCLVPETYSGKALGLLLAETIGKTPAPRPLVILPRSKIAGADITDALSAAAIPFLDIPVYDAAPPPRRDDPRFIELVTEGLDWLTFTSASTVSGFVRFAGTERTALLQKESLRALCIGEQTADAARRAGFAVITAKNATLNDMTASLLEEVGVRFL